MMREDEIKKELEELKNRIDRLEHIYKEYESKIAFCIHKLVEEKQKNEEKN